MMESLDQATALRRQGRKRARPPILGIVSGKGGVGKSALAVNLAMASSAAGARTLLVDADAGLANADLLLGAIPRFDLSDWCGGRIHAREALCPVAEGFDLVVSGRGRAVAHALLAAVKGDDPGELGAMFSEADLTLLDLGAGIGASVLELASACDPIWLVVTPEPTSLADAYAMVRELWALRPSARVEIVVNRAVDLETGERTYQALQRLTRRFLGRELPLRGVLFEDESMGRSVVRQIPVVRAAPRSRIARQLALLAESLVEDAPPGRFESMPAAPPSLPG